MSDSDGEMDIDKE